MFSDKYLCFRNRDSPQKVPQVPNGVCVGNVAFATQTCEVKRV